MANELDRTPDYTVFPQSDGVPALRAMQSITEDKVLMGIRRDLNASYKPVVQLFKNIDDRLDTATDKANQAIDALRDGIDPGEFEAYVDAQIEKISALVSKNAADIAQVGVAAVEQSMNAVVSGINEVAQTGVEVTSQVANALSGAFARMVNAITGKALGKWHQEIYIAAGSVSDGENDTPLGVTAPFDANIRSLRVRTEAFSPRDVEDSGISLEIVVNGAHKWYGRWSDGTTDKTFTMLIQLHAGDVIELFIKDVTADLAGLSATYSGDLV